MRRNNGPHDGVGVTFKGENPPKLPEGEAWVTVEDRPEPGENQRVERELTAEKYGWRVIDLSPEEIAARNPVRPVTKLTLMNRLLALGKWETFKAILASQSTIVRDAWALAQDIRSDDPLFAANREVFRTALGLPEEEFDELLKPSDDI